MLFVIAPQDGIGGALPFIRLILRSACKARLEGWAADNGPHGSRRRLRRLLTMRGGRGFGSSVVSQSISAIASSALRATARVTFWGALAMALTAGIGKIFGTVV